MQFRDTINLKKRKIIDKKSKYFKQNKNVYMDLSHIYDIKNRFFR